MSVGSRVRQANPTPRYGTVLKIEMFMGQEQAYVKFDDSAIPIWLLTVQLLEVS